MTMKPQSQMCNIYLTRRWCTHSLWLVMVMIAWTTHSNSKSGGCHVEAATATTQQHPRHYRTVVDLSHLPHVPAQKLAQAISSHRASDDDEKDENLMIDVSHCALQDAGFLTILQALWPSSTSSATTSSIETPTEAPCRLDLACRRNDLSPASVKALFERVLHASSAQVESLDLGWNHLSTDSLGGDHDHYHPLLERVMHSPSLHQLRLEHCGLSPDTCRALAKGLLGRHEASSKSSTKDAVVPPLSLILSRNSWIGDAGTAALAAALRSLALSREETNPPTTESSILLDTLDLSGCDLTDAGAQALALALEEVTDGSMAVRHLNLSHNQITHKGATALGRALILSSNGAVQSLDLSDNQIGDRGAAALAAALEQGKLQSLILRSCHIHADGASALGKALYTLTTTKQGSVPQARLVLDLSGNPLGILRGKVKTSFKSTATATAASYMNRIKKGIQGSGMGDFLGNGAADSDDEEAQPNEDQDEDDNADSEYSKKRCGVKALVDAFLGDENDNKENMKPGKSSNAQQSLKIDLGLRHCFLDHGAVDALAALLVEAREERRVKVSLDLALNPVLEEEMVQALEGDDSQDDELAEMAERYQDLRHALLESKRRAQEARARVRAQMQAEEAEEQSWGPSYLGDDENEDEEGFGGPSRRRRAQSRSSRQANYYEDDDEESYDDDELDAYDNDWEDDEDY